MDHWHREHIEQIIHRAASSLMKSQQAYSSERAGEISEANVVVHLGSELAKEGANVYAEFPFGDGTRLDLVSFFDTEDHWIGFECKNYLHSNQVKVLIDFERLSEFEGGLLAEGHETIKVMIVLNRFPFLTEWWKSRGQTEITPISSVDTKGVYEEIADFLMKENTIVGSVPWYPEQGEWEYELLYWIY